MATLGKLAIEAAVKKLRGSRVIPNTLSSDELLGIATDIREQAVFSAQVRKTEILGRIRRLALDVVTGKKKPEDARLALQRYVKGTGYVAPEGKEGTIQDLASDARTDLIVRMNVGLARGYGRKVAAQENLGRRPFWELYRQYEREEPRDWPSRWREAGGRMRRGRFIAPVNGAIWTSISRFGTPYPPFDFNSGMGVRGLTTTEGAEAGVAKPKKQEKQPPRAFKPVRRAALLVDEPDLRQVLLNSLNIGGAQYRIDASGILTQGTGFGGVPSSVAPRPRFTRLSERTPSEGSTSPISSPEKSGTITGKAKASLESGRITEAEQGFAQAVAEDQHDVDAWVGLAESKATSGKIGEGRKVFAEFKRTFAASNVPDVAKARYVMRWNANAQGLGLALAILTIASKKDASAATLESLALAQAGNGKFDDAVTTQKRLIRLWKEVSSSKDVARWEANVKRYENSEEGQVETFQGNGTL